MPTRQPTKAERRARRKDNLLCQTACTALRAWIAADRVDMPEAMHERLKKQARLLTGLAIDQGLLRDRQNTE